MNNVYYNSILLIGGMSIGKSTVSEILSKKLNIPVVSVDAYKDEVLLEDPNYNFDKQLEIRKNQGYIGEMNFLTPYVNKALSRILDNISFPQIIDISSLNTINENKQLISKIRKFKNVILLYSKSNEEILRRRNIDINSELGQIYLKTLKNPIDKKICTKKINVDSKTPEEITKEIIMTI